MQGCVMKILKKKEKDCTYFFVLKKIKFDRRLQKVIDTDQDETSSIKASYNKVFILYYHYGAPFCVKASTCLLNA